MRLPAGSLMLGIALCAANAQATPMADANLSLPDIATSSEENRRLLDEIGKDIIGKQPGSALAKADRIIAGLEAQYRDEKRIIYCVRSADEAAAAVSIATTTGKSATAIDRVWSTAYFFKGFALIDLDRFDEARAPLTRAVELSPLNSQFLAELAEWYKRRRDWETSIDLFRRAEAAIPYSDEMDRKQHRARAWRGIGFVLIEQGRLDEAEAIFRKALADNPDDAGAAGELKYIQDQRAKTAVRTD